MSFVAQNYKYKEVVLCCFCLFLFQHIKVLSDITLPLQKKFFSVAYSSEQVTGNCCLFLILNVKVLSSTKLQIQRKLLSVAYLPEQGTGNCCLFLIQNVKVLLSEEVLIQSKVFSVACSPEQGTGNCCLFFFFKILKSFLAQTFKQRENCSLLLFHLNREQRSVACFFSTY